MGRGEGVILDVKFLIFDWGRDCSRKAPTRVRGRVAKVGKDGKGGDF